MNRQCVSVVISVFSLLLGACSPFGTPSSTPTTGDIVGRVIESESGTVIPNANVTTDPPTSSVTADAGGIYSIGAVPPGNYQVIAVKAGYAGARVNVAVAAGRTTVADLHLIATARRTPVDAVMEGSLRDGLVAYYPFSGNAVDRSGNGNDGIVYGATLTADRFGSDDSAYAFDGADDYIASGSNIALYKTYSVVLWFNYAGSDGSGVLFHRGYGGWCWYEPIIYVEESAILKALVSGCQGEGLVGSSDVVRGRWYQVAVVVQDGSQRLYVNGHQVSSREHRLRYEFAYRGFMGVGANENTPTGNYFHGSIDDVRIYSRALSESEIQALYRAGGWTGE